MTWLITIVSIVVNAASDTVPICDILESTPGNQATVKFQIKDDKGIVGYYCGTNSNYAKNTYTNFKTPVKSAKITKTFTKDGKYYIAVKDAVGHITKKEVVIYNTIFDSQGGTVYANYEYKNIKSASIISVLAVKRTKLEDFRAHKDFIDNKYKCFADFNTYAWTDLSSKRTYTIIVSSNKIYYAEYSKHCNFIKNVCEGYISTN